MTFPTLLYEALAQVDRAWEELKRHTEGCPECPGVTTVRMNWYCEKGSALFKDWCFRMELAERILEKEGK